MIGLGLMDGQMLAGGCHLLLGLATVRPASLWLPWAKDRGTLDPKLTTHPPGPQPRMELPPGQTML